MVEYNEQTLDQTFAALADPTRRAIMSRLAQKELTVGELAEPFDMSLAAVSKHIRILTSANLISQQKQGRIRRCKLEPETLRQAARWVDYYKQFWGGALNSLGAYIENQDNDSTGEKETK